MICSSVNLVFFMFVILQRLTNFVPFSWYGLKGAGHNVDIVSGSTLLGGNGGQGGGAGGLSGLGTIGGAVALA